jgi:16S rRNA processing protein RimM
MKVGRPHGLDGSFHVDGPLEEGATVAIGEREYTVVQCKGTDARPIVRLSGVEDRDAAEALRGEAISTGTPEPPGEGEWLVEDLVGCRIEGVGEVTDVLMGMSCDVLQAGDVLIPLVTDAVTAVDVENRVIEVNREFLGL